jgi:hypothetical protein
MHQWFYFHHFVTMYNVTPEQLWDDARREFPTKPNDTFHRLQMDLNVGAKSTSLHATNTTILRWNHRIFATSPPAVDNETTVSGPWKPTNIPIVLDHHRLHHQAQLVVRPSHAVARFANGTLGYIADPTTLRRGMERAVVLLNTHALDASNGTRMRNVASILTTRPESYWTIQNLYAQSTLSSLSHYYSGQIWVPSGAAMDNVNETTVCWDGPGLGWEGGTGAYALLTETIRVAPAPSNNDTIRVLCAMYTVAIPRLYTLAQTAALTWGAQCDGFLAFSNVTVPNLGMVHLVHAGPEAYGNMWQKTRSIWRYLYQHYRFDYDYFHLSGDDVYVIVPNLQRFLHEQQELQAQEYPNSPPLVFAGQWIRQKNRPYLGGGPGYTLSREVLRRYMETNVWQTCHPSDTASHEDRLLSHCLGRLLTKPYAKPSNASGHHSFDFWTDARDAMTGAQLYHDCPPQQVFDGRPLAPNQTRKGTTLHARGLAYWETLPHPQNAYENQSSRGATTLSLQQRPVWMPALEPTDAVGPLLGLEAAGAYSIAFHKIGHPLFQARIHAILYPNLCPLQSPLGAARRAQHQRHSATAA